MKRFFLIMIVGLFFLFSLTGVCMGENSPNFLAYVQGGGSSIVEKPGGEYEITIQDIIPYIHQTKGDNGLLVPDNWLLKYPYPLNGAIVLTDAGGESTCIMNIFNISLYEEKNELTLYGAPLQYYEGKLLNSFTQKSEPLDINGIKNVNQTSLYIEVNMPAQSNYSGIDFCNCVYWYWGSGADLSESINYCKGDGDWDFTFC